jgi:hypothetical protein
LELLIVRIASRPLAPREIDFELITLSVSLGGLAAAMTWFALHLPWPRCLFRALTGYPCVTCGATRSAIEFFHGHFPAAWNLNPLIFSGLCAVAIFDAYAFVALALRAPRLRIENFTRPEKNIMRVAAVALLALNWIHVLRG